ESGCVTATIFATAAIACGATVLGFALGLGLPVVSLTPAAIHSRSWVTRAQAVEASKAQTAPVTTEGQRLWNHGRSSATGYDCMGCGVRVEVTRSWWYPASW